MSRGIASEADYARTAAAMASTFGWLCMHHPDSRRLVGDAGGPDLSLLHPAHGWRHIELKLDGKKRRPGQARWAETAAQAGQMIYLIELPSGWKALEAILRG